MSRKQTSPPWVSEAGVAKGAKASPKLVGPIPTVPLLNYTAGKMDKNNYTEWLPKMEPHVASIHGEASYSLISGELWEPEEIPLPEILATEDPLIQERKKSSYLTLNKDRDKQLLKLKREIYPSYFVATWNQMSQSS